LRAAEMPGPGLAAILGGAQEKPLPVMTQEGPAALLATLAGSETLPVACATPILLAVAREPAPSAGLRPAQGPLPAAPPPADAPAFVTRDGRFSLRYLAGAVPRDREVKPETVARFAEALVAARSYASASLGYADPAAGAAPVTVYLVRLGHGLEGYVV